jgi:ribose/xylose/arabinose/galactoside ABC-type transport system permease subunit
MGILLIGGDIDLSTSDVCLFSGVLCALLIKAGIPWGFAMVITLAIGGCIGAISAFLVLKVRIMSFMATIAVGTVLRGVTLYLTSAQNVPVSVESFWWGGRTFFGVIPIPFVIMAILMILYQFMLSYTQFGRNIYLIGGNIAAARLTGVHPGRIRTALFINSSMLASLAGIVLVSRLQSANPNTLAEHQINALTAIILGGIAFTGGAGGMLGCFIGVVLFSFFTSGLTSLALDAYWTLFASGGLLIIALTVDFFNERSRENMLKAKTKATADRIKADVI